MSYHKILIAADNNPHAFHAAERGLELANQLHGTVGFVFVIDPGIEALNGELFINHQNSLVFSMQEAQAAIKERIQKYTDIADVHYFMLEGAPQKEIINKAIEWNSDLIVMGTHGRTGLEHLLIGSTAEYVVRHSPIAVMVVPKRENQ